MNNVPENVYEFNDIPNGNAEINWFQAWFNACKPTFEAKKEQAKDLESSVELLGKLFADSVEVFSLYSNPCLILDLGL